MTDSSSPPPSDPSPSEREERRLPSPRSRAAPSDRLNPSKEIMHRNQEQLDAERQRHQSMQHHSLTQQSSPLFSYNRQPGPHNHIVPGAQSYPESSVPSSSASSTVPASTSYFHSQTYPNHPPPSHSRSIPYPAPLSQPLSQSSYPSYQSQPYSPHSGSLPSGSLPPVPSASPFNLSPSITSPTIPTSGVKRKRKSTTDKTATTSPQTPHEPPIATASGTGTNSESSPDAAGNSPANGSPNMIIQPSNSTAVNKRTKTQRACDPCRRKKIRCDILQDTNPPVCAHCRQYGFECTFFLPITETRFKKRKMEEEENNRLKEQAKESEARLSLQSKSNGTTRRDGPDGTASSSRPDGAGPTVTKQPSYDRRVSVPTEAKIYGPTSLSYILHASTTMPQFDSFDLRYHQTWRVGRSGEGFIQITEQRDQDQDDTPGDAPEKKPTTIEREVLERLVNSYFKNIAPLFPVILESEFLHGIGEDSQDPNESTYRPSQVLLYAICTMAATARDVPLHVFETLRIMMNTVIRSEDVLSNASLSNIQALLILGMTGEPHGRVVSHAMSAGWLRVSAAIRMAQDLGLHRSEAVKTDLQLRRRLWAACVITDRWYGLTLGLPYMIDVHDCDARLPGPELTLGPTPVTSEEAKHAISLLFMGEFVKLSLLLGKVTKTIYSPTGLIHTTDDALDRLLEELDRFVENLPPELVFRGPSSIGPAGLLHLFHTCVSMMFWRVFARIQYTVPAHLKFSLNVERWSALTKASADAIDWIDTHETVYDSWVFVAYSVTSCALIQYHTWARRKDPNAQESLRRLRDCVKRWDRIVQPGHMLTRRKTTEIISLLYEATYSPVPRNFWPLNPTAGVESRDPSDAANAIVFKKDPSRPGGGLFIATQRTANALGPDIPVGTLVVPDPQTEEHPENDGIVDPTPSNGLHSPYPPAAGNVAADAGVSALSPTNMASMRTNGEGSDQSNVNPNMNAGGQDVSHDVQVLNILDQPTNPAMMQQYAVSNGLLDGIPATMFEWEQWDNFFSRFQLPADARTLVEFANGDSAQFSGADGSGDSSSSNVAIGPLPPPPTFG